MFTCEVCHDQGEPRGGGRRNFSDRWEVRPGRSYGPAHGCVSAAEETFSRESTETIRLMFMDRAKPGKVVTLEVFEFTPLRKS